MKIFGGGGTPSIRMGEPAVIGKINKKSRRNSGLNKNIWWRRHPINTDGGTCGNGKNQKKKAGNFPA